MRPITIGQTITSRQDASLGLYFKDVSKLPLLTPEQEKELSTRVKNGDESAVHELVKGNLRFAISIAKQYQNKGLPLVDLVQEANLSLYRAAQTFDANKGVKFISYAVWWIRQGILKALSDQCRTVRVPISQIVYMNAANKLIHEFEQENQRNPDLEELNLDEERLVTTVNAYSKSLSLDTPINEEENSCLLDVIPNSLSTDREIIDTDISEKLDNIISNLSNREQDVLRMSFGLGMSPMQNEEIANRFGVCCERVRQIREEALEKLRMDYEIELKELI